MDDLVIPIDVFCSCGVFLGGQAELVCRNNQYSITVKPCSRCIEAEREDAELEAKQKDWA